MSFNESLTVRILGDSSGLRRELEQALDAFDRLEDRLSSAGSAARELANSFNRLSAATRPIQQVSSQLGQLSQQMRGISGQTVSINVQPALQSLQQLLMMIRQVAAALQALSSMGPAPGGLVPPPGGPAPPRPPRGFASGGLVTGPAGFDRVPARLTSGEFVLNRDAVAVLGLSLVERLNAGQAPSLMLAAAGGRNDAGRGSPERSDPSLQGGLERRRLAISVGLEATAPPSPPAGKTSGADDDEHRRGTAPTRWPSSPEERLPTVNNFGGIEIHVREAFEVGRLVEDFRKQGIATRNRRG